MKKVCLLLLLCLGFFTAKAQTYVASAELPATHFPLSESSQTVVIPMDNVKEALNAIEEGLYDQVFPAYTTIYFFNEDGEELNVPSSSPFGGSGLTAYTTAEGISVRVQAGVEFPQAVYHCLPPRKDEQQHGRARGLACHRAVRLHHPALGRRQQRRARRRLRGQRRAARHPLPPERVIADSSHPDGQRQGSPQRHRRGTVRPSIPGLHYHLLLRRERRRTVCALLLALRRQRPDGLHHSRGHQRPRTSGRRVSTGCLPQAAA